MAADDPILSKNHGGGPDSLCTCTHRCANHQWLDPGYCEICDDYKGFTDTGKTWGRKTVTLETWETVTFSVECRISRWRMFLAVFDPRYKGYIWATKTFKILNIMVKFGKPMVEIEYSEHKESLQ
jgi:hypothetical protein